MLKVGIISYLPDNEKRAKRKKYIDLAFTNLMKVIPKDVEVVVVAQNYREEDYKPGIKYIKFKEGIGPAKARNELLRYFYNSNADHLLYIDDDNFIYDRYHVSDLLNELHTNPDKFKMIDVFNGVCGAFEPFTKENSQLDLDHYYHFRKMIFQSTGELRIIKNFRKYKKKGIWYDENLELGEDLDLRLRLELRDDIFLFTCNNIIQGRYCQGAKYTVCWDAKDDYEYQQRQQENGASIKSKYEGNGRLMVRFKPGQNILRIPNEYKVDLTEYINRLD